MGFFFFFFWFFYRYVCRVPEGCFSADELASMFGIEGVVKVSFVVLFCVFD